MNERLPGYKIVLLVVIAGIALSHFPAYANIRIMTYNIKDFWLRFDGESIDIGEGRSLPIGHNTL